MKKNMLLLCKTVVISVKCQVPIFPDEVLRFFNSRLLLQDLLPDVRRDFDIRMKRFFIGFDGRSLAEFAALQDRRCIVGLKCIFNSHPQPENFSGKRRLRIIFTFQLAHLFLELIDKIFALLGFLIKNGGKIRMALCLFPGFSVSLYPVVVYSSQVFQENNKVFLFDKCNPSDFIFIFCETKFSVSCFKFIIFFLTTKGTRAI